jgi:16S rRNA (guanine(966)-N(2))-methyltransferase RsmD
LDLYAGTGAIGIEAMSRGAAHITFVESDRTACQVLRENVARCRGASNLLVCTSRVEQFLRHAPSWKGPYDIVFADPPYAMTLDVLPLLALLSQHGMASDAVVIVEHGRKTVFPSDVGTLLFHRRYEYGDTCLSLFHRGQKDRPPS